MSAEGYDVLLFLLIELSDRTAHAYAKRKLKLQFRPVVGDFISFETDEFTGSPATELDVIKVTWRVKEADFYVHLKDVWPYEKTEDVIAKWQVLHGFSLEWMNEECEDIDPLTREVIIDGDV